jgi:DNA-binding transcriptional LysR family regulator
VPLFVRSTRSLRLSAEGERLLPQVRQALQLLADGRAAAVAGRAALRGELQLAMPSDLGRNLLLPWLESFQQSHPQLALRLHLADHNADLMRAPVDMAIRYGTPAASAQVALPLAPHNRRVLVASPGYVAQHGVPASADELSQHEVLRFMLRGSFQKSWPLQIDGRWVDVPVNGRRSSNDGEVVKRWAVAGWGIAYKSWLDVASEIAAGRLVQLNPHWVGEPSPLYAVLPGRRQLSPATRALRDWLLQRFEPLAAAMPGGPG